MFEKNLKICAGLFALIRTFNLNLLKILSRTISTEKYATNDLGCDEKSSKENKNEVILLIIYSDRGFGPYNPLTEK